MSKLFSAVLTAAALLTLVPSLAAASVDINLSGGSVTVRQGGAYTEPGYTALSTTDGDVTGLVSVSNPGTGSIGTFTVGYSVTDSALDTATNFRSLTVVSNGGGAMPVCSGPMAPGWRIDVVGGGCGGHAVSFKSGTSIMINGVVYTCPDWFGMMDCTINQQ